MYFVEAGGSNGHRCDFEVHLVEDVLCQGVIQLFRVRFLVHIYKYYYIVDLFFVPFFEREELRNHIIRQEQSFLLAHENDYSVLFFLSCIIEEKLGP